MSKANRFFYTKLLGNAENPRDYGLPERSTDGSAGYDLRSPSSFVVEPKSYAFVSLGIKCSIKDGEFLLVLPRSSMGFNGNHVMLTNTAGVIDSDYFDNPSNEGQIGLGLFNMSDHAYEVKKGDKVAQAVFVKYDLAEGDSASGIRKGGFGSTGK